MTFTADEGARALVRDTLGDVASATRGRESGYTSGMDGTTTPGSRHAVAVEILYALGCPHLREVRGRLETVAVEEGFAISCLLYTSDAADE